MLELVGSELVKRAAERAKRREERLRAINSPWIKPRLDGAAIDDGNAGDEPSGPWASGVQPPADRGLLCT